MPYVSALVRQQLDGPLDALLDHPLRWERIRPGDLNYIVSRIIDRFLVAGAGLDYDKINAAIGVLECAKLELYRRVASRYEDGKKFVNGEVYRSAAQT